MLENVEKIWLSENNNKLIICGTLASLLDVVRVAQRQPMCSFTKYGCATLV